MVKFVIEVVIDPKSALPGARRVTNELKKTEGAASKLRKTLVGALGVLGAGALLTAATRTLANFGQEMSTVGAIAQATEAQFESLEQRALSLGSNTRFSATQAAEGMTFLARAGFDANAVFETIDDTLDLAQAGALGLGQAADIASNALTAFRLETDQAGRVVDVLAFAANNSNTTVAQLGDGLKLVAPIAAGLGVEIEETTAAISALSDAGLQATLAGTGLRRILSELESPNKRNQKLLRDLGLETEDYKISSVGLTVALQRLVDAGVDTGLALEVFGDRGGPAFEVLSSSIPKVEEMTASLNAAEGTARNIAEAMDDNLNGAILATKSALEGLILTVGESGATGALRGFFDLLTVGFRGASNNIDIMTVAVVGLSTAFVALRLAPIAAEVLGTAAAFVKLQVAVASGKAVILGSAAATKLQAIAEVEAAKATLAKTTADLASIQATSAKALVVAGAAETIFISAAVERQAAAAAAANTVASEALATSQAKLATATKAATVQMRIQSLINPFALAVTAIAAAGVGLSILLDRFKDVETLSNRATEAGAKFALTDFGKVGLDIARVQENLVQINKQIDNEVTKKGFANPVALKLAEQYEKQLEQLGATQDRLSGKTAKVAQEAREQAVAIASLDIAVSSVVESIGEENRLLGLNSRERQIQSALLQEIAALESESGIDTTDAQRASIEVALRQNQALAEQAAAFESIRGPQQEFNAQVAAFTALQEQGRISVEELDAALLELAASAKGVDLSSISAGAGEDLTEKLRQQLEATKALAAAETLRASIISEIEGPLIALQDRQAAIIDLEERGIITTDQAAVAFERAAESIRLLNPEYAAQASLLEELNGPQERLVERQATLDALFNQSAISAAVYAEETRKVTEALNPLTEAQQLQADLLADIKGPQEQLIATQEALGVLLDQNKISAEEYALAMADASNASDDLSNSVGAGLKAGLEQAKKDLFDVAGAAQNLVTNGFAAAEDALVSFVTTGELDFSAFVDGLIADIARLLVKQALLAAFGGPAGGAGGGAVGALFGGGKAGGGDVNPNQAFLVGEEGPEIFTPPGAGEIIPAGETAARLGSNGGQAAAPIVNVAPPAVNITNVSDPNEVPDGIESAAGEQAVMNVMRKNRQIVRNLI